MIWKLLTVSDQQKGLVAEHRFCMLHLYNNFKKQFKGQELKDLMWNAAKAPNAVYFRSAMEALKKKDVGAFKW